MGMVQKLLHGVKGKSVKLFALGMAALLGFGAQAHAALPQSITSVFETANANASDIGWVVLGLIAAIMAFKFIRRAF